MSTSLTASSMSLMVFFFLTKAPDVSDSAEDRIFRGGFWANPSAVFIRIGLGLSPHNCPQQPKMDFRREMGKYAVEQASDPNALIVKLSTPGGFDAKFTAYREESTVLRGPRIGRMQSHQGSWALVLSSRACSSNPGPKQTCIPS